ncbi:hypothetical protein [Spongiivirga citrea]|uniref:Uncharacterized protein n=1 Tax=Spongiivirga citrea TaxID=1481457 RepID=A0A6M0CIQ8_9FLAO|nr:hypothetical protein [Spongiivirga citrea]NER15854.1 hypothetical protein [Spongiivirga citrea]
MNDSNLKKDPKAGRVIGIVLLVIGGALTGILIVLVTTAQSLPKLLVAGPSLVGLGIGMFFFPGTNCTYKEMNRLGSKKGLHLLWSDAPILHRIIWIIGGIIGLAVSFKIMIAEGFLAAL